MCQEAKLAGDCDCPTTMTSYTYDAFWQADGSILASSIPSIVFFLSRLHNMTDADAQFYLTALFRDIDILKMIFTI